MAPVTELPRTERKAEPWVERIKRDIAETLRELELELVPSKPTEVSISRDARRASEEFLGKAPAAASANPLFDTGRIVNFLKFMGSKRASEGAPQRDVSSIDIAAVKQDVAAIMMREQVKQGLMEGGYDVKMAEDVVKTAWELESKMSEAEWIGNFAHKLVKDGKGKITAAEARQIAQTEWALQKKGPGPLQVDQAEIDSLVHNIIDLPSSSPKNKGGTQPRIGAEASSGSSTSGPWHFTQEFYVAIETTNIIVQHYAEPGKRAVLEAFAKTPGPLGDVARQFQNRLTPVESRHASFFDDMVNPKRRDAAHKTLMEKTYPEVRLLTAHDYELVDRAYDTNVVKSFEQAYLPFLDALRNHEIVSRSGGERPDLFKVRHSNAVELKDSIDLERPGSSFMNIPVEQKAKVDILVPDVATGQKLLDKLAASFPADKTPALNIQVGKEWPIFSTADFPPEKAQHKADVADWLHERGLVLDNLSFAQQGSLADYLSKDRHWGLGDLETLMGRDEVRRRIGFSTRASGAQVPIKKASNQ